METIEINIRRYAELLAAEERLERRLETDRNRRRRLHEKRAETTKAERAERAAAKAAAKADELVARYVPEAAKEAGK